MPRTEDHDPAPPDLEINSGNEAGRTRRIDLVLRECRHLQYHSTGDVSAIAGKEIGSHCQDRRYDPGDRKPGVPPADRKRRQSYGSEPPGSPSRDPSRHGLPSRTQWQWVVGIGKPIKPLKVRKHRMN